MVYFSVLIVVKVVTLVKQNFRGSSVVRDTIRPLARKQGMETDPWIVEEQRVRVVGEAT